jgi:hypothetical protein
VKLSALNRASLVAAVGAALLVWLLTAGSVIASLAIVLDPTSAPAGARVMGRTGGEGAFSSQVDPLATYLVASAAADQVTSANDTRLVEVGRLVVDSGGNGQIVFVVPGVDPGPYVVMVHCPTCAATSFGRTMLPVADFRVTAAAPSTDTGPSDPPRPPNLGAFGTVLIAAVLGVVALHRRLAR